MKYEQYTIFCRSIRVCFLLCALYKNILLECSILEYTWNACHQIYLFKTAMYTSYRHERLLMLLHAVWVRTLYSVHIYVNIIFMLALTQGKFRHIWHSWSKNNKVNGQTLVGSTCKSKVRISQGVQYLNVYKEHKYLITHRLFVVKNKNNLQQYDSLNMRITCFRYLAQT